MAKAVPTLIEALKDPHYTVRQGAALALGNIGDKRAVEPLIALLDDPHKYPSGMAATSLGKIGAVEALPALERVTRESEQPDMVQKAREAIAAIQAEAG